MTLERFYFTIFDVDQRGSGVFARASARASMMNIHQIVTHCEGPRPSWTENFTSMALRHEHIETVVPALFSGPDPPSLGNARKTGTRNGSA